MFLLFSLWLRRLKYCMCIFVLHVSRARCTCKSKYIEERCVCFSKFNIYINSLVVDHISMTNHITWILRGTLPPPDKQTRVPNYNLPLYLIVRTNDHMLHIAGAKLIALTKIGIHESFVTCGVGHSRVVIELFTFIILSITVLCPWSRCCWILSYGMSMGNNIVTNNFSLM